MGRDDPPPVTMPGDHADGGSGGGPALALAGALSGSSDRRALEEAFAPWRGRVHRRLLLRATLDGLTAGALAGAALRAPGWATPVPAPRPPPARPAPPTAGPRPPPPGAPP